jgi:hypothetical protein
MAVLMKLATDPNLKRVPDTRFSISGFFSSNTSPWGSDGFEF